MRDDDDIVTRTRLLGRNGKDVLTQAAVDNRWVFPGQVADPH